MGFNDFINLIILNLNWKFTDYKLKNRDFKHFVDLHTSTHFFFTVLRNRMFLNVQNKEMSTEWLMEVDVIFFHKLIVQLSRNEITLTACIFLER